MITSYQAAGPAPSRIHRHKRRSTGAVISKRPRCFATEKPFLREGYCGQLEFLGETSRRQFRYRISNRRDLRVDRLSQFAVRIQDLATWGSAWRARVGTFVLLRHGVFKAAWLCH